MRFFRRMPLKDIVRLLAVGFAGIFLLSAVILYTTDLESYPPLSARRLPSINSLRYRLCQRGPEATSYRELESYAADSVVRAILVTNEHGRIVKAYPRPHFFIGQNLPLTPSLDKAKNQVVHLMSRAGLGAYNHGVRAYEIVNSRDKLIGYIFVDFDAYAYHRRERQWQELIGVTACLSFGAYWLLTALWVSLDARVNRRRAFLWGAFALLTNLVGLVIYLLTKSMTPRLCPRCQRAMAQFRS